MKNKFWIIIAFVISIIMIVGVPILINELYILNRGYITLWGAPEVLSYYGTILSVLGTLSLGIIALYQTKKANNISERLLMIEECRNKPQVDIRLITSNVLKSYKREEFLKSTLPDIFLHFDEEMNEISNNGDVFKFEIKNLRDTDILDIRPISVCIKIVDSEKREVSKREYCLCTSINSNVLNGNSTIPFLLGLDKVWNDVYKKANRSLALEIVFLLMNYDGVEYREKIYLEMVNAYIDDSLTPAFISKKISRSEIYN